MLSESEKSQRRYYSRYQAVLVGAIGALFFFVMVGGLFASEYLGIKIFVVISLLVMGWIGMRIVRSGIETFDRGIRVRNVFSTFEVPWQKIERFEIGESELLPMVCLIRLKDGSEKHAVGIQERTNFPSGSAKAIADELNAELARRTGGGSAQPQVAVGSR